MIRCNKCDNPIKSKAEYRVQFSLNFWCPEVAHGKMYEQPMRHDTLRGDLCLECRNEANGALDELAKKFGCTIETALFFSDEPVDEKKVEEKV